MLIDLAVESCLLMLDLDSIELSFNRTLLLFSGHAVSVDSKQVVLRFVSVDLLLQVITLIVKLVAFVELYCLFAVKPRL